MYLRIGLLTVLALISTGCDAFPVDASKSDQAQGQAAAERPQSATETASKDSEDTETTFKYTEKPPFNALIDVSGKITLGRCTQGTCENFRWLGIDTISKSESTIVIQAKLETSESIFNVTFNCSYVNPTIDWGDGQLETLPLARDDGVHSDEDLAGASISSVKLYLSACHSDFGTGIPDGEEYGYKIVYPEYAEE